LFCTFIVEHAGLRVSSLTSSENRKHYSRKSWIMFECS
jgi:hypothetical protein